MGNRICLSTKGIVLVGLILFCLNPVAITFLVFLYFITSRITHRSFLYLSSFIFAAYISCINATKVPDNDLEMYLDYYKAVNYTDFFTYITFLSQGEAIKEPLFSVLNYILYWIIGSNTKVYIFCISFISYGLLAYSLIKLAFKLELSYKVIIFCICIMMFTPYLFIMSAHLVRQILATSLLFYLLVDTSFYNNKKWWLVIAMVLIHTTTLFFVVFLFLPILKDRLVGKRLYCVILCFCLLSLYQVLSSYLYVVFENIPIVGYILKRTSQNTTFELSSLSMLQLIVSFCIVFIPFYYYYFYDKLSSKPSGGYLFVYIFIFLFLFIILNLHQLELSVRFNFFIWFLLPFSSTFFFKMIRVSNVQMGVMSILLILFFTYYISHGTWVYEKVNYSIIAPISSYFNL